MVVYGDVRMVWGTRGMGPGTGIPPLGHQFPTVTPLGHQFPTVTPLGHHCTGYSTTGTPLYRLFHYWDTRYPTVLPLGHPPGYIPVDTPTRVHPRGDTLPGYHTRA